MADSLKRKSSSKQLLLNLIRVTAQRSQEDAEEVERERRRRAREKQRGEGSPSWPEPPPHNSLSHNTESDEELKPSCCLVLDEDEGFSDWSHRLENRNETEAQCDGRTKEQRPSTLQWKSDKEQKQQQQEDEEEQRWEPERSSRSQEASTRPPEKLPSNKKEVRTSYSSSVFLPQDARLQHATGQPVDRTSYLVAGTMKPRGGACQLDGAAKREEREAQQAQREEVQAALQREWRSAETQQGLTDEDDQEEEELSFTHEEKEDLRFRTERRQKEQEEEQRMLDERSMEDRHQRTEEVNRRSSASLCSSKAAAAGEEPLNCYGPMSPTFKKLLIQFYPDEVNSRVSTDGKCTITERTESLRKSTSNVKKTPPPVPVSKIDKRLEQYTHALELSTKEGRSGVPALTDLMSPTEPVASKKNLFEAGDAWNQNAISVTPSKDADGLKVGVADLINQWVRGGEDGSRCSSPSKPADIKPGDVLNKKNLWEGLTDTLSPGKEGKESSAGKRYKFVVTGHGKYEKVSVDDCGEDANYQSDGQFHEDL